MRIYKEQSIDFKINLSITLLTLFVGFVFSIQNKNELKVILIALTLIFLLSSILLNQRKKYRLSLRAHIFNEQVKDFMKNSLSSIEAVFYKVGRQDAIEIAEKFFRENVSLIKNKSKEEVRFYLDLYFEGRKGKDEKSLDHMAGLVSDGVMSQVERIRSESFSKPLSERFARFNCMLDIISFKFSDYILILGILGFLITSIFLLF